MTQTERLILENQMEIMRALMDLNVPLDRFTSLSEHILKTHVHLNESE